MCSMWRRLILLFTAAIFIYPGIVRAGDTHTIYYFYGQGCMHCARVDAYFTEEHLYDRYPVEKREIYFNQNNALAFEYQMDRLNVRSRGVPAVVIGDTVLTGDTPIIERFVAEADAYLAESTKSALPAQAQPAERKPADLTIAAVIGASIVDAINPCAFAVLIILMTTILASGGGKKALLSGIAFAVSIYISYFLMGLGIYKALDIGGMSAVFYTVVGWLAILLGLFNLKDYFWYGKGFLMEVPMSWRPALKKLIHSVTNPLGAFTVGFAVSLFLLPCTSGPYIVILGMLAKNVFEAKAIMYLALYNAIFVSPMLVITWAVYKGFDPHRAEKIRQQRLRLLHLIAGIIMLAMGTVIIAGWV